MSIIEIWDDKRGTIRALYAHTWDEERIGKIMVDKQNLLEEQSTNGVGRSKRKKADEEKTRRTTIKYVEELSERGVVDPAFAFALKHAGDLPRYVISLCSSELSPTSRVSRPGKKLDPRVAEITQLEWNGFVDEYIRSGVDSRDPVLIERCAKINLTGGALYRQCEGPGCTKWEGEELVTLRLCSKCKIVGDCTINTLEPWTDVS